MSSRMVKHRLRHDICDAILIFAEMLSVDLLSTFASPCRLGKPTNGDMKRSQDNFDNNTSLKEKAEAIDPPVTVER